jgi:hypothetical protein
VIVFNLWGALFVALGFMVGTAFRSRGAAMGFELVAAGVVGILFDLVLRAHKSGPWKGTRVGNVASDLFDPALGGMVMVLPIWLWGLAAIVFGALHVTGVL